MKKINNNLTAIEQKFLSLKATNQQYHQPKPISQVAEVITFGTIKKSQVQDYIQWFKRSSQAQANYKINQKWYQLQVQQMINFLDRVIKHKKIAKQRSSSEKLTPSPQKIKTKHSINQVHQNPYIPKKITASTNTLIEFQTIHSENNMPQTCLTNKSSVGQIQTDQLNKQEDQHIALPKIQLKEKNIGIGLPDNFLNLPVKQKYSILSKKFGKSKSILEKKFDLIYKHYRKEMYIPFQSFQLNNQLLMDMRIFLKYYREFQLSKRFKTNEAIKHFKKIALNGLWLDDKMFNELHYNIVDIFEINQEIFEEQQQKSQSIQNYQTATQIQQQISKNIKNLIHNILKINELSGLVSDQKVNQIFNNNILKNPIKKIVEAHSGLIKDDVMLKLQERVDERKLRKNLLMENYNISKFGQAHIIKLESSPSKFLQDKSQRLSPHQLSIYQQLEIPKLRSRQLKNWSVYSSLQILDMQKEKQKLKKIINQKDKEQFLDVYFRKQKQALPLPRSSSVSLIRSPTQNEDLTGKFSIKSVRFAKSFNQDNLLQRNLSLPRMKFS